MFEVAPCHDHLLMMGLAAPAAQDLVCTFLLMLLLFKYAAGKSRKIERRMG